MPFKHHAAQRHRTPLQKFRVKNWPEYEAGLRQRGSITFWINEAAIAGWLAPRRTTPGGQSRYSDLAIETSLMCGIVFHQPLRQTEGLMSSLLQLMGLDLAVPDHTTLSRRCSSLSLSKDLVRHKTAASGDPIHVLIDSTGLKSVCLQKAPTTASSSTDRTVERGSLGPVGRSTTELRLRHFATVF